MRKTIIYPPGAWTLLARQWERALRSENKSHNTIHAYIQAVRMLGEWSYRQDPGVQPDEITHHHIQAFIAELLARTSAGNAHTNYRGLRTFWKWMVLEEEVEHSPMDKTKPSQVPEKPVPVITDDGIKALLDVCRVVTSPLAETPRSSACCSTPGRDCPRWRTWSRTTSTWTST